MGFFIVSGFQAVVSFDDKTTISPMKYLFILPHFFLSFTCLAQTVEFQGNVKLNYNHKVYKVVTVPNCPTQYTAPAGTETTITYETKFTNNKTEIKVESIVDGAAPIVLNANKIVKVEIFPNAGGNANFYLDEKDKSVLYVNYWLNAVQKVSASTRIQHFNVEINCDGNSKMVPRGNVEILPEDREYSLWRVSPGSNDINTTWFRTSDHIAVYKSDTTVDYYLVNRFDRNAKYILDLPNRGTILYNSKSLDLGALTIPFKYRFGFKRNDIEIKDDVVATFNIGVYAGYKLTQYRLRNKSGTYVNETFSSLRIGPFISLSTAALDSVTSTVGTEPLKKDEKQNIAVLSTGLGLMYDIKGVQFGIFGGWDVGMGSDAINWNYNKRFWMGFGIGYRLTDLFAKKE